MNGCKWYCLSKFSDAELKEIIDKKIRWEKLSNEEANIFKVCNKPKCLNLDQVKRVSRIYSERLISEVEKSLY